MKRISLIALLLLAGMTQTFARDGYRIQLKFTDFKDTTVYLTHYYGEPLPKIYKSDSAHFDKNGTAVLESKEKVVGGIYMILMSDHKTYFEFLLNDGDDISITATAAKLPLGLLFKNSPENDRFQQYVTFLQDFGKEQQSFVKELENAKTKADTADVRKRATESSKKLTAFRRDYIKKYPKTLLANIFNSLETPEVPEGPHLLPNGDKDSMFAYNYYKAHFWDGFDFQDDRLINTPVYDGKLTEYMNKMVYAWPDSVEHESDMILAKTRGTKELFKYSLWYLTRYAENSKVMGMDEAFVYLVENYYMKGDATWLTNEDLQKYIDRASKIAPNVIGNVAPEVKLKEVATGKEISMLGVKAKYTLLIFYSPDCGHCMTEMPQIDSLYRAVLKGKGVKIYAVATEGFDDNQKKIKDFVKKYKLEDWIMTSDPEHTSDFRAKYDVYSTPTIYLLDEKKIIRGKRIDHSNIATVIEFSERRDKDKTTKK